MSGWSSSGETGEAVRLVAGAHTAWHTCPWTELFKPKVGSAATTQLRVQSVLFSSTVLVWKTLTGLRASGHLHGTNWRPAGASRPRRPFCWHHQGPGWGLAASISATRHARFTEETELYLAFYLLLSVLCFIDWAGLEGSMRGEHGQKCLLHPLVTQLSNPSSKRHGGTEIRNKKI